MNWLVSLSGDNSLMDIISRSIPEILLCSCYDDRYLFFYDPSMGFLTGEEVSNDAGNKIALIRGISLMVLNGDPDIKVESISQTQQEREVCIKDLPALDGGDFIISCDDGDDEEILIKSPFESVYLAAVSDESLNAVIKAIPENFGTWAGFLKLFRMIESSVGSPVAKGWCSDDELDWFIYSAGTLSSDKSWDSCEGNDSSEFMYLSEAESFLTILMQEWIKEKKRELEI